MPKQTTTTIISLLLAFSGFLDATYLTIIHYKHIVPPCSLAHGCETVLTSVYSTIGPIPIALVGSLYFLGILKVLLIKPYFHVKWLPGYYKLLVSAGLVVSLMLVGIQAFLLHAFCQYCLGVEAINLLLFILSFI